MTDQGGTGAGTQAVEIHVEMELEGPLTNPDTKERMYTVHGPQRDIRFSVLPQKGPDGASGWDVQIEGIPGPSIVRDEPWTTPDAACKAVLQAIRSIFVLEEMQRRDQEGSKPQPDEEPCEDPT